MRQGRIEKVQKKYVSLDNEISIDQFLNICEYLNSLCQNFSEESTAFSAIEKSQKILRKIQFFLQKIKTKQEDLKGLTGKLSKNLVKIKSHLRNHQENDVVEIKEVVQNLGSILRRYSSFDLNSGMFLSRKQALSTGAQSLHLLGFSKIVHMINAASAQEPKWMSRTGALLILDSNPNTSQVLERRLVKDGHQVFMAENDAQAFEILQFYSVDLILVDYSVFQDNLYSFLENIKKDLGIEYIPIIVMGASENAEGIQQIIETGVGDYLEKPVNPALLRARVRSALEKKYAFEERAKRKHLQEMQRLELEESIQGLSDGFAIFDQDNHMVMHNDKLFDYYPNLKKWAVMNRGSLTFDKLLESNIAANLYVFSEIGEDFRYKWIEEKKANFLRPASQWEESLTNGRVLSITTYRTPDGGGALVAKDISQDKTRHQDLTFLAYHDSLTGLANRKAFHQRLTQSVSLNSQEVESSFLAVLFLDLDGFKEINDNYGHEMGDWLLIQVAQRLYRSIRGDDFVARIGGDEFSIILNYIPNRNMLEGVVRRILKSVSEPYIRNDITLKVGASIGISIYSPQTNNSDMLMNQADNAMYAVKKEGKGHFRFYDEVVGK